MVKSRRNLCEVYTNLPEAVDSSVVTYTEKPPGQIKFTLKEHGPEPHCQAPHSLRPILPMAPGSASVFLPGFRRLCKQQLYALL